jgi:bla regulator protein blaR1
MSWLMAIGLTNAVLAGLLALLAWGVGRCCRRPALTRLLWIVVLCKLFAPPLAKAPVGDWLPVPHGWLSEAAPAIVAEQGSVGVAATLSTETGGVGFSGGAGSSGALAMAGQGPAAARIPAADLTASAVRPAAGGTDIRPTGARQSWLSVLSAVSAANCLRALAVVWICGSVVSIIWFAHQAWRFRRFLARFAREDAALSRRVARLAREAGLRSAPRVLVVESAVSPMLWGAGRAACLLFPAELTRRIDGDACDALLLHELSHYARADWLVRLLELAAQVVYWWHPLVWWARREIEAVEEECCDAWVVGRRGASPRTYAEALLATVDFLCEPSPMLPPAACGLGAAPLLRSRLTHIMCGDVAMQPSRAAKALVLAGAVVALPLGPAFVGSAPQEAVALSTPSTGVAPAVPTPAIEIAAQPVVEEASPSTPAEVKPASWFVPRDLPRVGSVLYATAVSPNGRYKLQAHTGHRTALIDVERVSKLDKLDLSFYRILSASFSPDSRLLVTGQEDDSAVRLWNCENGEFKFLLKGSEAAITAVAFAPDGQHVAAGAADGSVLVWSVDEEEREEEPIARLPRQDTPVSCVRWSKDGARLAVALSDWSNRDFSSVLVWQPADGTVSREFSVDHATAALEWLADDELLVADWTGDGHVINAASGLPVERLWLGKDMVSAAAFSTDCPLLPRWQASRFDEYSNR